jgi:hypothetical protein
MLKRFVEGKNTSWVIDLNKQIDDFPLFMDATRVIDDAIRQDIREGYSSENGPRYGIERYRAEEYASYVSDRLSRDNYLKFDTPIYRFFLGSVPVRRQPISKGE